MVAYLARENAHPNGKKLVATSQVFGACMGRIGLVRYLNLIRKGDRHPFPQWQACHEALLGRSDRLATVVGRYRQGLGCTWTGD
jgi:hypothetical protein